jgi:hypothetical protein
MVGVGVSWIVLILGTGLIALGALGFVAIFGSLRGIRFGRPPKLTCPQCGGETPANTPTCEKCGHEL